METHAHVFTRAAQLAAAEAGGARKAETSRGRRADRAPTTTYAQGESGTHPKARGMTFET